MSRQRIEELRQIPGIHHAARGVVGAHHNRHLRGRCHGSQQGVEVIRTIGAQRRRHPGGALHHRALTVRDERRPAHGQLVTWVKQGHAQDFDEAVHPIAHRDRRRVDSVQIGKRVPQRPCTGVGVQILISGRGGNGVDGRRERGQWPLVRCQLHHLDVAEFASDVLERPPWHVGLNGLKRRSEERGVEVRCVGHFLEATLAADAGTR